MKLRILKECTEIALKNNNPNSHPQWDHYKHYSFVIQDNTLIAWGTNKPGSPLTFLGYKPYQKIHSETVAYFKAAKRMDKNRSFEVINIRLSKTNTFKPSAPCKCCCNFLRNLGCVRIWFSMTNGMFCSLNANNLSP